MLVLSGDVIYRIKALSLLVAPEKVIESMNETIDRSIDIDDEMHERSGIWTTHPRKMLLDGINKPSRT
jgi:hypothetical protein